MEITSRALWVLIISLCSLSFGLVKGSHAVYRDLESTPAIPAVVIESKYRTGYHFQPPMHWINDPNGPMYYNGIYHLFYQYNPYSAVWGNITWAHSVSTDLVNWKPLPLAITATKPFDINGCWSGSATVLPGNRPAILYTGKDALGRQVQNVAYPKNLSDPYLTEWVKPDYNPVIAPVNGINATEFRDPTTAWTGPDGHWRIVVGSVRGKRGMALLYRSRDFVRWTRAKHPLHTSSGTGMWECPDFYPVAEKSKLGVDTSGYGSEMKHVLKVSLDLTRFEYYTIGSYDRESERYVPDGLTPDNRTGLRYDYGNFYASKTFFDAGKKRRILWGWSNESDSVKDDLSRGWAGIQTIPREIWLDSKGKQLIQWPVVELESLRGKVVSVENRKLKSGDFVEISGIMTSQSDVEVSFELSDLSKAEAFDPSWSDPQRLCEEKGGDGKGGVGPFGLWALASANKEEHTSVYFRIFKAPAKYVALMCHDPSRSSVRPGLYKPTYGGFVDVDIQKHGKISLRSLIDHSVFESFGGEGRTCMTSRVYPTQALGEDAHLFVYNYGAEDVKIAELKAWEMKKPLMNGE